MGAHPDTAPKEGERPPWSRTASRPWLATRSTVQGTGQRFDRRFALVAAASRGRLAVRGQCPDAPE